MRLTIAAVGRLKSGAEHDLVALYLDRADAAGRKVGLSVSVREVPEGRAGRAADRIRDEAAALAAVLPPGPVVALDEHGESISSTDFADRLARWRDGGTAEVAFLVGGADGLDPGLLRRAELRLAFGAMTWPHRLVRAMLAEQLYRAVAILAGHPYHRA